MFGDIALITILVSINMAIIMLVLFMYYIGRSGQDGNYRNHAAYEKRGE